MRKRDEFRCRIPQVGKRVGKPFPAGSDLTAEHLFQPC